MKHKLVAPANARYRCGFPGCSKRYVSTDGVRKHARKMHNDDACCVFSHNMVTHVSSHVSTPVHVLYTERSERENGGRTQAAPLQTAAARTLQPSPRSVIRASVDRRVSQRQIELVLPGSAAHGNAAAAVVSAILVLVLILILGVCAAAHAEGLQVVAQPVCVGVA